MHEMRACVSRSLSYAGELRGLVREMPRSMKERRWGFREKPARVDVDRGPTTLSDLPVKRVPQIVAFLASAVGVACGGVVGSATGDSGADAADVGADAALVPCVDAGSLEGVCCSPAPPPLGSCPANWAFAQSCGSRGVLFTEPCGGFVALGYSGIDPGPDYLVIFDVSSGRLVAVVVGGPMVNGPMYWQPWQCLGALNGSVALPRRCLDAWWAGSVSQPCTPNGDFLSFCSTCRDNCTCIGDACSSASQCCSGNCDPASHQCACLPAGAPCIDEECCAGSRCDFNSGTCSSTCTPPLGSCASNGDCCSASCNSMYHQCDPCRESGTACDVAGDCCSSMCVHNVCL